jgi:nitroreductase
MNERRFGSDIMQEIKERWSPRAFSNEKISDDDLSAILEAARYAPSCFNEQPWKFIVAEEADELVKMLNILAPQNQEWAKNAAILILVLSKKTFEANGKENYWHMFDAGTTLGYLSLEAQRRGLITHAMGGFSKEKAAEVYNISNEYSILAVVAVGKYGNFDELFDNIKEREQPGTRKELKEIIIK